jgi:hypothetical protein
MNLIWNLAAVYSFVIHNKLPVNGGNYTRMQNRNIWIVITEVNVATSPTIVWKFFFTDCKERMFQFHACEGLDRKYLACCQQYLVVCV